MAFISLLLAVGFARYLGLTPSFPFLYNQCFIACKLTAVLTGFIMAWEMEIYFLILVLLL